MDTIFQRLQPILLVLIYHVSNPWGSSVILTHLMIPVSWTDLSALPWPFGHSCCISPKPKSWNKPVHKQVDTHLLLSSHQMLPMLLDQKQPHDRHPPSSSSLRKQVTDTSLHQFKKLNFRQLFLFLLFLLFPLFPFEIIPCISSFQCFVIVISPA